MAKKVSVLRMNGRGPEVFARVFNLMNGIDGDGNDSGFRGGIDAEGYFSLVRKGGDTKSRMNYDARLTGRVRQEGDETVIEYTSSQSALFAAGYAVVGAAAAAFSAFAAARYFAQDKVGAMLPASFLLLCFLVMTAVMIIKPDRRALEKHLMKIAESYAE